MCCWVGVEVFFRWGCLGFGGCGFVVMFVGM